MMHTDAELDGVCVSEVRIFDEFIYISDLFRVHVQE